MIKLKSVKKIYRTSTIETTALNNVDFHVKKGEFISVMGPSGSGKSTLLNIIGLLDRQSEGEVIIDNIDIGNLSDRKLAKLRNKKLGFIFQSFHLINDLNVLDNVELPLLYRKVPGSVRKKLALEALEKVGLKNRTKHFPNQLSGGQRQRVAIARAIVGKPEVILADEPTGNLDSVMGEEIMDILLSLHKKENTTIVMVTHDERLAKKSEHIVRFFDGAKVM